MKRAFLLLVLVLTGAIPALAAPRRSSEIFTTGYEPVKATNKGWHSVVVSRPTKLEMWVTSRALMRAFGTTTPGWNKFIADPGELVYGVLVKSDEEYHYWEVKRLARADCENAVRGELKIIRRKIARLEVPKFEQVVVEQESPVYLFTRERKVVRMQVAPPEQRLLISLAPAQDQKAEFQKGSAQFSPQNAVIGLLPRARLSATGGSGGTASAASSSSSAASAAAASNSGGELAPPPANAPVDAAGAGATAPPGPLIVNRS